MMWTEGLARICPAVGVILHSTTQVPAAFGVASHGACLHPADHHPFLRSDSGGHATTNDCSAA